MQNLQRKKLWNEKIGSGHQIQVGMEFKAKSTKLETNSNKLIQGTDITYKCSCVIIIGLNLCNTKYIKAVTNYKK